MTSTLVLGGVRSGKSRHAEALLRREPHVRYVATAQQADESDPTWATRVADHRARRPDAWETVETIDVAGAIRSATSPVLIDCLGIWLARTIDGLEGWEDPDATSLLLRESVADLRSAWVAAPVDVVAVTNEVGLGVVPPSASGRLFRDELGRLNTALSAASDRVHLVVAGRVLDLSHAPRVDE
ncbi:MAG TPA: bifunctional adenosylcobinamide kinase/adenosylcobinamide-phosphate guanylyltransferase [Microlunatus sp.]|nr:bifunctional adenosylcobinamide kinase/adenosylcobinamide-phosphate guanylyltransferase [Microlunatus sp.]